MKTKSQNRQCFFALACGVGLLNFIMFWSVLAVFRFFAIISVLRAGVANFCQSFCRGAILKVSFGGDVRFFSGLAGLNNYVW